MRTSEASGSFRLRPDRQYVARPRLDLRAMDDGTCQLAFRFTGAEICALSMRLHLRTLLSLKNATDCLLAKSWLLFSIA